jgi:hypothetical protein
MALSAAERQRRSRELRKAEFGEAALKKKMLTESVPATTRTSLPVMKRQESV